MKYIQETKDFVVVKMNNNFFLFGKGKEWADLEFL